MLGCDDALCCHPSVTERVRSAQFTEPEALHEFPRITLLFVDLNRLPGAHQAQLGVVIEHPAPSIVGVGVNDDHGVTGADLWPIAAAECAR